MNRGEDQGDRADTQGREWIGHQTEQGMAGQTGHMRHIHHKSSVGQNHRTGQDKRHYKGHGTGMDKTRDQQKRPTEETDQTWGLTRYQGETLDISGDLTAEETGTRTNRTGHTMTGWTSRGAINIGAGTVHTMHDRALVQGLRHEEQKQGVSRELYRH